MKFCVYFHHVHECVDIHRIYMFISINFTGDKVTKGFRGYNFVSKFYISKIQSKNPNRMKSEKNDDLTLSS